MFGHSPTPEIEIAALAEHAVAAMPAGPPNRAAYQRVVEALTGAVTSGFVRRVHTTCHVGVGPRCTLNAKQLRDWLSSIDAGRVLAAEFPAIRTWPGLEATSP